MAKCGGKVLRYQYEETDVEQQPGEPDCFCESCEYEGPMAREHERVPFRDARVEADFAAEGDAG